MQYESTLVTHYAGGIKLAERATPNSTAIHAVPVFGVFQSTVAFTLAAISSGQTGVITLASTSADVQPGDLVGYSIAWTAEPAGGVAIGGYRLSSANTSRLTCLVVNPGSSATATLSGAITVTWFDLT